jgi:TnpA family transposase
VRALVGGKINEPLIERNWPDILRIMATIAAGINRPQPDSSQARLLPRRMSVALALREVGRIERTLFMIDWILMPASSARLRSASTRVRPTTP